MRWTTRVVEYVMKCEHEFHVHHTEENYCSWSSRIGQKLCVVVVVADYMCANGMDFKNRKVVEVKVLPMQWRIVSNVKCQRV